MFLMLAAAALVGYATGLLETLGYESRTVSGGGFTSSSQGLSLGFKTVYVPAGHVFFVDYETHVKTGALHVALLKVWAPGEQKARFSHHVSETSDGQLVFPITESGWYDVVLDGSVLGRGPPGSGYDLSYTARWGIR